jgi:hypothetical protein
MAGSDLDADAAAMDKLEPAAIAGRFWQMEMAPEKRME